MEPASNSLYNLTRVRILDEMLGEIRQLAPYLVLVVDKKSLGFLNSVATVLDVTERGASVIERLEKSRKPMPDVEAVYFLTPSEYVVKKLVEDFANQPMYRQAHLFFTSDVSDTLMRYMANSSIYPYVKTFKEANCEYKLLGQEAFSLERKGILGNLYLSNADERAPFIISMAKQICGLCSVLKELPSVCFQSSSQIARELGLEVEQQMEILLRKIPDLSINDNRATLIILDRKFDLATPLAHDVHYEAMAKDLLNISHDGNVSYEATDNTNIKAIKEAVINEIDPLWVKYKYEEVDDAQHILAEDLKDFRSRNQEIESMQQQPEITDMRMAAKVVSSLAEYNDLVSKFSLHSFLMDKCLQAFLSEGIKEITEIEQILMTGIDTMKNEVKEDKIIEKIVRIISGIQNPKERLRLAMLATVTMELKDRDRKAITDQLQTNQLLTVTKLANLGIDLQNSENKGKSMKRIDKESVRLLKNKISSIQKVFCYAVPKLSDILHSAIKNQIDPNFFEFGRRGGQSLIEPPDSTGVSLRKKPVARGSIQTKRIIIFILGGVSYAEYRFVKEFPDVQVIIGGSRVMTPNEFIEDIANMEHKARFEEEEEKIDHQEIHLDLDFR